MLLHHVYKTCELRREIKRWSQSGMSDKKNSSLSKRLVVLRKLIAWTNISLLTVSLYLSEPNKRMSDNISSFKFLKETSILNKLFRNFCLFSAKSGQHKKKWSVVSVSEPQSHIGLGTSLKLWRNLCSFKWLNFNRILDPW